MSESHPSPPSPDVIARGHELTTVNPRYFVIALIGFIVFSVVLSLLLVGMMRGLSREVGKREQSPHATWVATSQPVPPQPWLQPSIAQGPDPRQPWQDTQEFRQREMQVLDSYGSLDQATGTVRIPIDRAMHILAERGVPTSQPSGGAK